MNWNQENFPTFHVNRQKGKEYEIRIIQEKGKGSQNISLLVREGSLNGEISTQAKVFVETKTMVPYIFFQKQFTVMEYFHISHYHSCTSLQPNEVGKGKSE